MSELQQQVARRLEKLERWRTAGVEPYPARWRPSHTAREARELFASLEGRHEQADEGTRVAVGGRLTGRRGMGGATFLDLQDRSGRLQAQVRRDTVGPETYRMLDQIDLGDFVGVRGPLFRTRSGEITVAAEALDLLAKAIRPLPEKWHGIHDREKRYRQRYLDLIANPGTREVLRLRSRVVAALRRFLDSRDFLEVETPVLVPVAAGAMARPFVTRHHSLGTDLYLRIATELYLKRLVVGGVERVYEAGRVFRNEGIDQDHNPEFTLLEAYQAYADYHDIMRLVEELVGSLCEEVLGTPHVPFGEEVIDFEPPWRRVPLAEEVERRTGIDLSRCEEAEALANRVRGLGIAVEEGRGRGYLVDKLISAALQPHLVQPTFLVDYPLEMSPLAKEKPGFPGTVERFEGFAAGMELANAFSELNDPLEQRRRMEAQEAMYVPSAPDSADRVDEDFLVALEHGMPPTGGLGMGIDRLVMLFTDQHSIREVLPFPQLRT